MYRVPVGYEINKKGKTGLSELQFVYVDEKYALGIPRWFIVEELKIAADPKKIFENLSNHHGYSMTIFFDKSHRTSLNANKHIPLVKIDFVLVSKKHSEEDDAEEDSDCCQTITGSSKESIKDRRMRQIERRKLFEEELMKAGILCIELEVLYPNDRHNHMIREYETSHLNRPPLVTPEMQTIPEECQYRFLGLHASDEALLTEAQFLSLEKPMEENPEDENTQKDSDKYQIPDVSWLTNAQRNLLVYSILKWTVYERVIQKIGTTEEGRKETNNIDDKIEEGAATDDDDDDIAEKYGIKNLLNDGTYTDAYPLHDYKHKNPVKKQSDKKKSPVSLQKLFQKWARLGKLLTPQPIDEIREYFGEKIAIYFEFLGFYTMMLVPAAVVGIAVFAYGVVTVPDDVLSKQVCDRERAGNLTLCPQRDCNNCSYWHLIVMCDKSHATYLFDNTATIVFACLMGLWASIFHELWKRQEAKLQVNWGVRNFEEDEMVRPEFDSLLDEDSDAFGVNTKHINKVTGFREPKLALWSKCMRYAASTSVIIFFLCLTLGAVFGVIVYRVIVGALIHAKPDLDGQNAGWITSGTAAAISLIVMMALEKVYQKITKCLTDMEYPRTETEWEDSYIFKMFLFNFVNYYSSIFYIAFLKGRFVGLPGGMDYDLSKRLFEECDPTGCLIDLCIQLAIVMVGKQALQNVIETLKLWFLTPCLNCVKKKCEKCCNSVCERCCQCSRKDCKICCTHFWQICFDCGCFCKCICSCRCCQRNDDGIPDWIRDYRLAEAPQHGPFEEYLEMVIQYGFLTIFAAAFPLAPFFALMNNLFEIRLDAYKLTRKYRRPVAERAQDIGIWFGILQGISAVAVVSNACIMAFTSEFIPRMVYKYVYSPDQTMDGFFENFTLSIFNTSDFEKPELLNISENAGIEICRYRDFRSPPGTAHEYEYTIKFWHVLAARLAFVLVFENVVVFVTWLVMYLVPDIPRSVKIKILREKYRDRQEQRKGRESTVSGNQSQSLLHYF